MSEKPNELVAEMLTLAQWACGSAVVAGFAYAVWSYLRIATDIPNTSFFAAISNPVSMSARGRAYRDRHFAAILLMVLAGVLGGIIEGCLK